MLKLANTQRTDGGSVTVALPDDDYQPLAPFEAPESEPTRDPNVYPLPGTFAVVIDHFQTEPESTFHGLRYHVRQNCRSLLARISGRYGHYQLAAIDTVDIKGWYRAWSAGGEKLASGHAFIGQLRTLLTHGVLLLPNGPEREECRRIKQLLSSMKFVQPPPRVECLTVAQVVAIRAAAHEHFGWGSIALAQALQFDLMLRQGDVIGTWVPESEPGEAVVTHRGEKWGRGLRWSEIDGDMILRHVTSKRQKMLAADLKLCPMVLEELELSVTRSTSGPVVICDITGLPWKASEFRRKWRMVADHVGVPRSVKSMDSRAGAITEALDAGVDRTLVQQGALHSNASMTDRYDRGNKLARQSKMQEGRLEARKKAQGE